MSLAEMIVEYSIDHNVTRDELAAELSMTRGSLRNKMYGHQEFKLSEAYKLSKILGITVDELCRVAPKRQRAKSTVSGRE